MNASLFAADRKTHIKIVVVAFLAVIVVTGLGIRIHDADKGDKAFVTIAKTTLTVAEKAPQAPLKVR